MTELAIALFITSNVADYSASTLQSQARYGLKSARLWRQ